MLRLGERRSRWWDRRMENGQYLVNWIWGHCPWPGMTRLNAWCWACQLRGPRRFNVCTRHGHILLLGKLRSWENSLYGRLKYSINLHEVLDETCLSVNVSDYRYVFITAQLAFIVGLKKKICTDMRRRVCDCGWGGIESGVISLSLLSSSLS